MYKEVKHHKFHKISTAFRIGLWSTRNESD